MSAKKEEKNNNEIGFDLALRPGTWNEYVGQEKAKTNLRLIIDAAKKRGESCDHLLFYGQAGLGKTTLAYLVGKEMGVQVRSTTGPALEKAGDVAAILSNIEPHEILFIDEAHRINKLVEEILYPALE
ncbi:MAG: AAA family ATPase, partial [Candidatus Gracilibacteria bacterium]